MRKEVIKLTTFFTFTTHYLIVLIARNNTIGKVQTRDRQTHVAINICEIKRVSTSTTKHVEAPYRTMNKCSISTTQVYTVTACIRQLAITYLYLRHPYI